MSSQSKTIQDAYKMLEANKLKFTYRWTDRKISNNERESVAAHTWGMTLIADYLLERLEELAPWKYNLNREKIYSLIHYHDLLEAEIWDIDLNPKLWRNHADKDKLEADAAKSFPYKLPKEIQNKFITLLDEYETRATLESQFVKIVDIVECQFLIVDKPFIFTHWTKEYYEEKRRPHFEKIPELLVIHQEILDFYVENDYFE